jgi:hypothetical protein
MNKVVRYFSKAFLLALFGSIAISCVSYVHLDKIKNNFENMNNIKVLKVWHDDDDLDSAGAAITIDDDKLLIFRRLSEKSFSSNGNVAINRIGNYKVSVYSYSYESQSIGMSPFIFFGENSVFNKKYDSKIVTLEDVINNYDEILSIIHNLPENNEPLNLFKFTSETFNRLKTDLSYYYDQKNDKGYIIRKIKVKDINLDELNTQAMWFEYMD